MFLLVIVLLVLALPAVRASAQEGWTGIVTDLEAPVREGYASGFSAIGADLAGNVRVVWSQWTVDGAASVVRTTSRRRDTGIWSEPVEVFRTTDTYGVICGQLLVDDLGNATASCHTDNADQVVTLVALRYTAADDSWRADELDHAVGLIRPYLALDGDGNVFAVWSSTTLKLRRLDRQTNLWGPMVSLPFAGEAPLMVADKTGNLFVTWRIVLTGVSAIYGAHYNAAAGRWSAASTIPVADHSVGAVSLALDPGGHATIVWGQWTTSGVRSAIRTARYSPAVGWEPVRDVARYPAEFSEPRVVTDDYGNAVAAWFAWLGPGRGRIEAAVYVAETNSWSASRVLSPESNAVSWPVVVADGQGNATIGWLQAQGIWSGVRAVRYTRSMAAFGEMVEVAPTYPYLPLLWMTADPDGAATAVWQHHEGTDVIIQSARWEPTPAAPVIAWATVEPGALRLNVTRPADREPAFTATNYEYSTDDGATWVPRVPPSTASPIDISGLPGGASALQLRAVNRAGPGRRSASYPVTLGPAPAAPVNLAVRRVAGDVVSVGWTQPDGVTQPDGYVLEGGSAPGGVIVRIPTGGTAPAFTFTSPRGVYYVRLRAFTGASFSLPSNDIPLVVAVDLPPSPPTNLLAVVNGSTLALSWTNTNTGGSPTAMRLDVTGTWTGAIPLVSSEGFAAGGIPAGTYTMTVTAMNAAGFSAPSNAVIVQLPGACSGPPAAPRNLAAGANGRRIQVLWDAPAMGPAVTGYDVMVTGPFAATVHTSERMVSGDVTPGLYSIRVIATNPCGPSAPTPSRSVTVY